MKTSYSRTFYLALLLVAISYSRSQGGIRQKESAEGELKAEVTVSPTVRSYQVGEPIMLKFEITNTGTQPFNIPAIVRKSTPDGGFTTRVVEPKVRAEFAQGSADFPPNYGRELTTGSTERWLLLLPGEFYGGIIPAGVRILEPGVYHIVAQRDPPKIAEKERVAIESILKHKILVQPIESKPLAIRIVR